MSLIGKCHANLEVTRNRDCYCFVWQNCANPFCPFQDSYSGRILYPDDVLDFHFQMQGKIKQASSCFTASNSSFGRWGFISHQMGFWKAQTTETVWESVLKSPEQFRNYFSCSQFRSKQKHQVGTNKHMLLCIYF